MQQGKILGNTSITAQASFSFSVSFSLLKMGILIFTRGIPTFSNENENEASGIFGVFPKLCSSCIGPIVLCNGTELDF